MSNALQLSGSPAKVLIVEDEQALRETMAFRFEKEGFSVFVAANGLEALAIITDQLPDIILTDVRMPKMDGKELLQNIKSKYPDGNVPIVFCVTGYSDISEEEAAELWVDRFFHKPFDPGVLVAAGRADLDKLKSRLRLKDSVLGYMRGDDVEGFLKAAMIHEINNTLNVGNFSVAQLKRHFEKFIPDKDIAKSLLRIDTVFNRMQGVTTLLTRIIRSQNIKPDSVLVVSILKNVLDEAQIRFPGTEFRLDNKCEGTQNVSAIPYSAQIALVNLTKNAYEAQYENDDRQIELSVMKEGGFVCFRVSNPGSIPDAIAAKIFDPFFSTKDDDEASGMGVGLAIAKNLISESGGDLTLESHKTTTTFCMKLPLVF